MTDQESKMQLSIRDENRAVRYSKPIIWREHEIVWQDAVDELKADGADVVIFRNDHEVCEAKILCEGELTGYLTSHKITEEEYTEQVANLKAQNGEEIRQQKFDQNVRDFGGFPAG